MINSLNNHQNIDPLSNIGINNIKKSSECKFVLPIEKGPKCPYSALAKDGMIEYNGVVFACDFKHNAITLGDVTSDPQKVLNISLPSGGSLKVNVDNLGDISRAAGMFTPEDLNAILNAINLYNHCTSKLNEIEDEENRTPQENAVDENLMEQIKEHKEFLYQKIINNDTEQKFTIGNAEYSVKEWDKLIESFDKAEEDVQKEIEEREEEISEEELQKRIQKLFEETSSN